MEPKKNRKEKVSRKFRKSKGWDLTNCLLFFSFFVIFFLDLTSCHTNVYNREWDLEDRQVLEYEARVREELSDEFEGRRTRPEVRRSSISSWFRKREILIPWEFLEDEFEERRTRTRGTRWNQYRNSNIETKKTQTPDSQSELLKDEFEERRTRTRGTLIGIASQRKQRESTSSRFTTAALAFSSCIHKCQFITTLGSSFVILTHYPSFS